MTIKIISYFLLSVLTIMTGFNKKVYSATEVPLVFSVQLKDTHKDGLAIDSPTWIEASLINVGNKEVVIMIPASEDHEISFQLAPDSAKGSMIRPRSGYLERILNEIVIKPGSRVTFDVLLNEFVQITIPGKIHLTCEINIQDGKGKPLTLQSPLHLSFTRKLNTKEVAQLVQHLEVDLDSQSRGDRMNAVMSAYALEPMDALPLLTQAINNAHEYVQLDALGILSYFNFPQATAIIEKALGSKYESVQETAKQELAKRKRG